MQESRIVTGNSSSSHAEHAKLWNQPSSEDIFDFIRDTVLLQNLDHFPPSDRPSVLDWVLRFQQVTGPIMAKGIEDTAFYVYNKLISLNDVGGHPDRCASTLEAFHEQNAERAQSLARDHALLVDARHQEKRGRSRTDQRACRTGRRLETERDGLARSDAEPRLAD